MAKKTPPATPDTNGAWAGTADEWARRAGPHNVTLDSGMRITFRVLGLQSLVRLDALPEELNLAVTLHVANLDRGGLAAVIQERSIAAISDPEAAKDAMAYTRQLGELTVHLVAEALIAPKLTVEQLRDPNVVPEGDLEQLMRLCTGRQEFDAAGVRIGVEPISSLTRFRTHHDCPPDCPSCEKVIEDISSVYVGSL